MADVGTILSDAGLSVGALTLNVVLRGLLILLIGIICVRLILSLFDRHMGKNPKIAPLSGYLRPALKFILMLIVILTVLGSLGVQVTSFIALLSVAGLAVSLALQNTLSNIAGGIMVLISKPLAVGEYVSIDGMEGTVESITLSYTKLLTIDNKEIHIPNSQVASAKITNFTHQPLRRVDLTFSASYNTPTRTVKAALKDAMAQFPQIKSSPEPEIHLSAYGSSSITYLIRAWVDTADYWDVYWGLLEQVRESFAKGGVEVTYDHVNVHMLEKQ